MKVGSTLGYEDPGAEPTAKAVPVMGRHLDLEDLGFRGSANSSADSIRSLLHQKSSCPRTVCPPGLHLWVSCPVGLKARIGCPDEGREASPAVSYQFASGCCTATEPKMPKPRPAVSRHQASCAVEWLLRGGSGTARGRRQHSCVTYQHYIVTTWSSN